MAQKKLKMCNINPPPTKHISSSHKFLNTAQTTVFPMNYEIALVTAIKKNT